MASVALETVLLSPLSDLATTIPLDVASLVENDNASGEVRVYASGNVRSIRRAGRIRTFAVTFDVVQNRAQLEALRGLKGETVLLRDPYGRKSYCVFFGLPITERIPVDVATVSITFQEITISEEV